MGTRLMISVVKQDNDIADIISRYHNLGAETNKVAYG
jgi:hypothetical protein